jgi:threonine/homoserine/homoserine lactone efflux protein
MSLSLILQGIIVGFSIAAPVGAIGLLCIEQTLRNGMKLGFVSGLGAATADTFYGIIIALGLTATQQLLLSYKWFLSIAGGFFLCYLGQKKFFSLPKHSHKAHPDSNIIKAYFMTFLLTLTNPTTIIDFAALFTGLTINTSHYSDSLSFVLGVFLGSAFWWFILSITVGSFRHRIHDKMLRYINQISGVVIFTFGGYSLAKALLVNFFEIAISSASFFVPIRIVI